MPGGSSKRKSLRDHPIIIIIGVLAALTSVIATIRTLTDSDESGGGATTPVQQTAKGVPSPPTDISGPILTEDDLRFMEYGSKSGCYGEGNTYEMIVIKAGQDIFRSSSTPYFVLQDERGVREHYYIDNDVSNATASWIPLLMAPGRRLRVSYMLCGNGGIPFLTYIEPLPAKR